MYKRVLIANRSEIASRIARTVKRLGAEAVGIYSWPEKEAAHLIDMDLNLELSDSDPLAGYLNIDNIVKLAVHNKCDAIHPGYGFLSENPKFAEAVTKAGISFVGPSAECMQNLGDKLKAKQLAQRAKVPMAGSLELSGTLQQKIKQASQFAHEFKLPFLIKASAGGGGRGMRLVTDPSEISQKLEQAYHEAQLAFGNGQLYCEQLITAARHIEVQILADLHKNIFVFYDRECSIQRNHQKILEEAPAPNLSDTTRKKLYDYAKKLVNQSGYTNAGTVEFLVSNSEEIYFLEVNSRLQVEHPVSELITGYDLVELQLRSAQGENLKNFIKLPSLPKSSQHAIELRICAELPHRNFMPSSGQIKFLPDPMLSNLRIDNGIKVGSHVLPYFDSLLSKVISFADNRIQVISQLRRALEVYNTVGVENNTALLANILHNSDFNDGQLNTDFIKNLDYSNQYLSALEQAAAIATFVRLVKFNHHINNLQNFRLGADRISNQQLFHDDQHFNFKVKIDDDNQCQIYRSNSLLADFHLKQVFNDRISYTDMLHADSIHFATLYEIDQKLWVSCRLGSFCFSLHNPNNTKKFTKLELNKHIITNLPGRILKILVLEGDKVQAGQQIALLESMKMEHSLCCQATGKIAKLHVTAGQQIDAHTIVAELEFVNDQ